MMPISIINLILSIFGISVSSVFILFWCGRYICARFLFRRTPGARALLLSRITINRRAVEHSSAGVNPMVIAYFPTTTFHEGMFQSSQDAMCAVCLGEYRVGETLRFLPQCGHNFHVNCIDAWLQQHATCPVCRMSLQGYFVGRLMPSNSLLSGSTSNPRENESENSTARTLSPLPIVLTGVTLSQAVCDSDSSCNDLTEVVTDRPSSVAIDVEERHLGPSAASSSGTVATVTLPGA